MVKKSGESGSMSKVDAVRAALAEGVTKPQEGCEWIKSKFGIELTPAHFSSYKSTEAKKEAPASVEAKPAVAPAAAIPAPKTNGKHLATGGAVALATQLKGLITQYGADEVSGMLGVLRD